MKIGITGHRPSKLGNDYKLKSPLIKWIRNEIEVIISANEPDELISGMAQGIDTLFAKIAMFMDIPLIAAIPFLGQEDKWSDDDKILYKKILSWFRTKKVVVSRGGYEPWKMQKRNEWIVDNCDLLIAVWDGSTGGTKNCVKYAKKKSRNMIVINPKTKEINYFFHEKKKPV